MSNQNWKKEMVFPTNLSDRDIELVWQQCRIQGDADKPEAVRVFAEAYSLVKAISVTRAFPSNQEEVEALILYLGEMLDSKHNSNGYRKVPVRFTATEFAVAPALVPQAMSGFCWAYARGTLKSDDAHEEFEKIHPFFDGNGRIGDLLWKMAVTRESGEWPESLPPNIFGENRSMVDQLT